MKNKIEIAYILCAGKGTRMGPLGKILPKVMWPVFEKNMLELQIKYARSLGMKRIFINIHHCAAVVKDFIRDLNCQDVIVIHEEDLLDSGGAIHNLMEKYNIKEKILLLNGDQFLFSNSLREFIKNCEISDATATLVQIKVNKGEKYNRLCVQNELLAEIIPSNDQEVDRYPTTYSGVAIIDLHKLNFVAGASKFFETVANFKTSKISCVLFPVYEYWDFGTIENYMARHNEIIKKLLKNINESEFIMFIQNENAVVPSKILRERAYNSSLDMNYLFSKDFQIVNEKVFFKGETFNLE
jgi:NDP-sugar pyrophosphorylase family protein